MPKLPILLPANRYRATDKAVKSYFCPKCGVEVPLCDINVSADIMLCKNCGEASSFAEAMDEAGDEDVLRNSPPKHLRVDSDPLDPERGTTITYRKLSPMAMFLVPFTCFWAGGSMTGIYGSQLMKGKFDLHMSLFGLPFLIGSIALVSACLFMLFGKRVLKLRGGEARYFVGVFGIGLRKRFSYDCRTKASRGLASMQNKRGPEVGEVQVLPSDGSGKVRMFAIADDDAVCYIVEFLRRAFR